MFIGKDLNHEAIQGLLDKCLLQDEEMELGPRKWQEMWYALKIVIIPTNISIHCKHPAHFFVASNGRRRHIVKILLLARYDTVDKIRLPTRLFLEQTYYDNAVVKVEAMEEFEDKQNMTISEVNKGGVL